MSTPRPERDYRVLLKDALVELKQLRARLDAAKGTAPEPIAILGMGCRLPGGADSPEAFWTLLCEGVDAIRDVPADRWDPAADYAPEPFGPEMIHTRWGGFLDRIDAFDPAFFGISQGEADGMDPQQRLLLEVSWEALERAAIAPEAIAGSRTGVIVGISNMCDYYRDMAHPPKRSGTGVANCVAANRLSYFLDLHGPSLVVDTACSSASVGLHLACQSLRTGDCDLALAGGVNAVLSPRWMISFSMAGMLAADGRCKSFDAAADGFVRSEGCVVLVLKRLSDALADGDAVQAVIRGSAVNQDGRSSALTVPNGMAIQQVIRRGLDDAGVAPHQIGYFEAHGLGSEMGDSIEFGALAAVLSQGRAAGQRCLIGSAKANIGHTEPVSGLAGVLKSVLALQHGEVPRQINLRTANPLLPLEGSPFEIPREHAAWPASDGPRFAGVNSFGIGGTNAFTVLSSAPETLPVDGSEPTPVPHILTVSARTEPALRELAARYAAYLRDRPACPVETVCHTAATGRSHFAQRLALVADTRRDLTDRLDVWASGLPADGAFSGCRLDPDPPPITFWVAQADPAFVEIGRTAYPALRVFRQAIDRCDDALQGSVRLRAALEAGSGGAAVNAASIAPLSVAVAYALAEQWQAWGLAPAAVAGVGTGELVAAVLAGVLSPEDALLTAAAWGQTPPHEPAPRPTGGIVSGSRPLRPWASTLTGEWQSAAPAGEPSPWMRLRDAIPRSDRAVEVLCTKGYDHILQVGPGNAWTPSRGVWFLPFAQGPDAVRGMRECLARLYAVGVRVDWRRVDFGTRRTTDLPTYPWQHVHCRLDPGEFQPIRPNPA